MLYLQNIRKSFPASFKPVLEDLSLMLAPGDFCTIIGSNGSGKSTLLKTISGEHALDEGHIFLEDKDITALPPSARAQSISSVYQDVTKGTVQEMTLLENLALGHMRPRAARLQNYAKDQDVLKTHVTSLNMGLEQYFHTPLKALSGGQRQMIAMAMAVLSPPKVLLLDEHCSALDPRTSVKVMEYTAEVVAKHRITTLMITHNLKDALASGNRLIMLHQGKIVLDVRDAQKQDLTTQQLLDLFHRYEDALLIEGAP